VFIHGATDQMNMVCHDGNGMKRIILVTGGFKKLGMQQLCLGGGKQNHGPLHLASGIIFQSWNIRGIGLLRLVVMMPLTVFVANTRDKPPCIAG